jgi:hypothetical protein
MAIRPFEETLVTYSQAARRLPPRRRDRPVHPATIHRWASHGLRGVRLESASIGGIRMTSLEALARFFAALDQLPPIERSPSEVQQCEAVERALSKEGL